MQRVSGAGATVDGHFTEGNPALGQPATVVTADWLNASQDEQENLIVAAGLTPDVGDNAQLAAAVGILIGRAQGQKNALINGDFLIGQRDLSSNLVSISTGPKYYLDRWQHTADTAAGTGTAQLTQQAFTLGQTAVPGGPQFFLRHLQNASATVSTPIVAQKVENVRAWDGVVGTLSVWLKAAAALSVTAKISQNFGTGGSPSAAVVAGTQVCALSTSWKKFTLTVTFASIAGKTLGTAGNHHVAIEFVCPTGQTFTLDIAHAQFELGAIATELEGRTPQFELLLAQRYYEKSYELTTNPASNTPTGAVRFWINAGSTQTLFPELGIPFVVEKRAVPTVTWYSYAFGGGGSAAANQVQLNNGAGQGVDATVSGTTSTSKKRLGYPTASISSLQGMCGAHFTADAEL